MRLNHYAEQCGRGIKRKHYPIQYEKGVEKMQKKTQIVSIVMILIWKI